MEHVITIIIFAYGLYVAVELARRTQLLCAQYTKAISREYRSDYIMFYICSLSRLLFRYVLEWDKVGQSVIHQRAERYVCIQYTPYPPMSNNHTLALTG